MLKTIKRKAVILIVVMGTLLIISILCVIALYIMTQESRIAEHKIKRMRALYAAQAGLVVTFESLRKGDWTTYNSYYCINGPVDSGVSCTDIITDSEIPYNVQIYVGPQGGGISNTTQIEVKVEY
jgi:Tfp pilus assembly protein PilX